MEKTKIKKSTEKEIHSLLLSSHLKVFAQGIPWDTNQSSQNFWRRFIHIEYNREWWLQLNQIQVFTVQLSANKQRSSIHLPIKHV